MNEDNLAPEWSHTVDVDTIEEKPLKLNISPNEEEVKALTKRLGVSGLDKFNVALSLKRQNQVIHVQGALSARVTQPCVVTLDPVETEIHDEFEAWYADPDAAISIAKVRREREMDKGKADLPMLDENEDPEAIVDGEIDLGELATQYLSLSINPYVHADGVEYEYGDEEGDKKPSETRENPFAALKDWKDKLK